MKTYILHEADIPSYYNNAIKGVTSVSEALLRASVMGLEEMELEDAKRKAAIGDCFLFEYDGKLIPFQLIDRKINGDQVDCVMSSYYVLDNHIFDEHTNVWRDSSIRRYMNEDMAKKFSKELLAVVKPTKVHTADYVTEDKFWLLSHEEVGYTDDMNMFKKNEGTRVFDYYRTDDQQDVAKAA